MYFSFNFCSVFIVLNSFLLNIENDFFNFCFNFRSVVIVLISFLLNIGKEMNYYCFILFFFFC